MSNNPSHEILFNIPFEYFTPNLYFVVNKDEEKPLVKRQKTVSSNILDNLNPSLDRHQQSLRKHLEYMWRHHFDFYKERCGGKLTFPKTVEDIKYKHINDDNFISQVTHFLGKNARAFYNISNEKLSPKSADDYLSAFKKWCLLRFRQQKEPNTFKAFQWNQYRTKLKKWKKQERLVQGKPLSKPTTAANDTDRWTSFAMCVWCNLVQGALFLLVFNILVQIGGRVSESSTCLKEDITVEVSYFWNMLNFSLCISLTFIIVNV